MHNLHVGVCHAKNHDEAEAFVDQKIEDWGTENNWRTICGSVAENGKIHSSGHGGWKPLSIKSLNKMVSEALTPIKDALDDKAVDYTLNLYREKKLTNEDYFNCYIVSQYFRKLSASLEAERKAGKEAFDFFKHSYNENRFDEFGVTHFGTACACANGFLSSPINLVPKQKGLKKFAVFIDMHS